MNYGPSLPPTGGGISLTLTGTGLVWGISAGSWLVVSVALLGLILMCYAHIRLLRGQRRLR